MPKPVFSYGMRHHTPCRSWPGISLGSRCLNFVKMVHQVYHLGISLDLLALPKCSFQKGIYYIVDYDSVSEKDLPVLTLSSCSNFTLSKVAIELLFTYYNSINKSLKRKRPHLYQGFIFSTEQTRKGSDGSEVWGKIIS